MSYEELADIEAELKKNNLKEVVIPTVLTAAPGVLEVFEKTDNIMNGGKKRNG